MDKQCNPKYEYVPYREYSQLRNYFESELLPLVRAAARKEGITFQHFLIGSGRRRMVTRVIGGNRGFDLDYNFDLQRCPEDPKDTKLAMMRCLDKVLVPRGFRHSEDSTTVITVKKVKKGRIVYSFDIALIFDDGEDVSYIHNDKGTGRYLWNTRGGQLHLGEKIEAIEEYYDDSVYNVIWDQYLHLKNINSDYQKRSFSLLAEAINNEFNRLVQTGCIVVQEPYDPYLDDDD